MRKVPKRGETVERAPVRFLEQHHIGPEARDDPGHPDTGRVAALQVPRGHGQIHRSVLCRVARRPLVDYVWVTICCAAHVLPSGSLKYVNQPQGCLSTSLASTPRDRSSSRSFSASSTTT